MSELSTEQKAYLEEFIQGYKECALWSSTVLDGEHEMDAGQAGHDFWLTRNGHGAGFWDRGLEERGEELSKMCKTFGSVDLYGSGEDDSKVDC